MFLHARQVHAENIFAFAQIGGFENLLALQRAVRLHLDLAQAIVGIFEEEPLRSETHSDEKSGANSGREPDFRNHDKHATVAMPRGLVRTHADIEKMLLADVKWWVQHRPEVIKRFDAWILK